MDRRTFLSAIAGGTAGVTGCLSPGESAGAGGSPKSTPDCSGATIDSVHLSALTSGDFVEVRGTVTDLPAPALRGFVVNTEGGEKHRDDISISLDSTGTFSRQFDYPHHAIVDYAFWLRGCPDRTPTPEAD